MRLTFACLLFIVICMTVSARYPYGYGANNKDKKSWFRSVARWTRSAFGAAKRWTRSAFETAIRSDRWEKKRGFYARQDKPEEMWAEMVNALDKDHDGFVDINELKEDMNTILEGETRTPEELMEETDTNGDGNVDFDEFVNDISSDM